MVATLNLTLHFIVRIRRNNPELQRTPKQSLDVLVIVSDRRLPDILHRLTSLFLRIRLVLPNPMQESVEYMHILHRQLRPLPHRTTLNQCSHRHPIVSLRALSHIQQRNLLIHPYRHVVAILNHFRRVTIIQPTLYPPIRRTYQPAHLSKINLGPVFHVLVHNRIHTLQHNRHPIVKRSAVIAIHHLSELPFPRAHADTRINIVRTPVNGHAHLNRSRTVLRDPAPMVIYNSR